MDGFRFNPSAGSTGGGLKLLPPESYNNQNITSVELIGPDGRVIERGRYVRVADGRKNYRFSKPGWAYPSNIRVRVVVAGGKSEIFNPRDGIKSGERGPSGPPIGGRGDNNQGSGSTSSQGPRPAPGDGGDEGEDFEGEGGSGSIEDGENFDSFYSPDGNQVAIPNFVDFNPADYFVNLDEAIDYGRAEGQYNLDLFGDNFARGKDYALQTQQTELEGLESFLPRTSNLIRQADAQGNADILRYSDVFDARNEQTFRRATQGNVALRTDLAESKFPGLFKSANGMRTRAEGDVSRVREREGITFIDKVLEEQAVRAARGRGGDIAQTTGFGVDSSAGTSIMDNFDIDKRLEVEQLRREDARRGDTAIYGAENQVGNALIQSQNLFNTVIAPGIRDFTPSQPAPRVTDIGGQIRPMPSVDAGTLQREFTSQQNAVSMLAPSQVFEGSINTQKYNSGVGLQALGFAQDANNTIAGAANQGFNQDKADSVFDQQLQSFQDGLDAREDSQTLQSGTQLGIAGLGVLGGLINSYNSDSNPQTKEDKRQGIGSAILQGGKDFYNAASDYLQTNFGLDIGTFDPGTGGSGGSSGFGGFENTPQPSTGYGGFSGPGGNPRGGTGGGFAGSGDTFDMDAQLAIPDQTQEQHDNEVAQFEAGMATGGPSQGHDEYYGAIGEDDFYQDITTTQEDFGLSDEGFDYGITQEGQQPVDYTLDGAADTFDFSGGLDYGDNEYVSLARTTKESSGVEVIPKKEILESFTTKDPKLRSLVLQKGETKGIPTATMIQAYELYDNWEKLSDTDKAAGTAQLLNSLATSAGVVDGTIPGAVVNSLRQGANLYENWDEMSDGQKTRATASVVGSLGSMAAVASGAGGPVGMAIVFGAAALGNAAATLIDGGITDVNSLTTVIAPMEAQGVRMLNGLTGNNVHPKDASHIALAASGPVGWVALAADFAGIDLDFSSGKPRQQQFRDSLRGHMQNINFLGKDYTKMMADGSVFDFGKDGNAKLQNIDRNIDGKTDRNYGDVDFSNPIAGKVTAWANVATQLGFRSPEGKKMTGYFVNAATQANPTNLAQAKDNLKGMMFDMGVDYNTGIKILDAMKDQFSQEEYQVYRNDLMELLLK